jgi:quinol-cytochrome oxidoreductase complex cytochrome b subunit
MSEIEAHKEPDSIPFYPDHISTELRVVVAMIIIAVIIGAIGLFFPVGLGDPADPMNTPAHAKPEWYFLFLYQILKFTSKSAGAVLPVIGVILLTLLPFLDRKPDSNKQIYRIRFVIAAIAVITVIALTIWGEIS